MLSDFIPRFICVLFPKHCGFAKKIVYKNNANTFDPYMRSQRPNNLKAAYCVLLGVVSVIILAMDRCN